MNLTVLGCAGTFPSASSGCSSYLLEHDGFRVMIDCGSGAVSALQRHGDLLDVDAVVLSHLHADHCLDLVAYAYARCYHPTRRPGALPVYAPRGAAERIARATESGRSAWLESIYEWRLLREGTFEVGPLRFEARRVAHPVECYGLRATAAGRTLAYSADTGPCEALVRTARGADLFLCEASFVETQENPPALHLTGRQAAQAAGAADVGSLLLTHLVAWYGEAQVLGEATNAYSGDLRLARSGLTYPV